LREKERSITIQPVNINRWHDLEVLSGECGAFATCWCMFWRLKRVEFNALSKDGKKARMKELVEHGSVPGLLAYVDGKPVGWCSLGPREHYLALERSRRLKRIDKQPVWSIVCFFMDKKYRRQGLMSELVRGAVEYAVGQGAKIVEAYPIDMQSPKLTGRKLTGYGGYMGMAKVFFVNGFVEVDRVSETQLIVRYFVDQ
jgi:GNAT superfamily N-acetyltransferase